MRVVILGSGSVGTTLAEHWVRTGNDITVVDKEITCLKQLQEKFDLRVVQGHAAFPDILQEAGLGDADILIAVTSSDEINMVACQLAYTLFSVPMKVARIRCLEYTRQSCVLFNQKTIPVDYVLAPERLVAEHIYYLITFPNIEKVTTLTEGKVGLLQVMCEDNLLLVGIKICLINQQMADADLNIRLVGVIRDKQLLFSNDEILIETKDKLLFIAPREQFESFITYWNQFNKSYKRLIIVGGGVVGANLAKKLVPYYHVKLIERQAQQAASLAAMLPEAVIFCSDASDQTLLLKEHIEDTDVFISVTNKDEINMMSAMLAKHLGAKKTIALIQHPIYQEMAFEEKINLIVPPQQITCSLMLTLLTKPHIMSAFYLDESVSSVIECIVRDELASAQFIGKTVDQLILPGGLFVVAIVHQNHLIVHCNHVTIALNDHLIIFCVDHQKLSDIDNLSKPMSVSSSKHIF